MPVNEKTPKTAAKSAVSKPAIAKPAVAKPAVAKPAVVKPAMAKAAAAPAPKLAVKAETPKAAPAKAAPEKAAPAKLVSVASAAPAPAPATPAPAKPVAAKPAAAPLPTLVASVKPDVPAPAAKPVQAKAVPIAPAAPVKAPEPKPALVAASVLPSAAPAALSGLAATGLGQAREAYATLRNSAETLVGSLGASRDETAKGLQEFSTTLIDAIQKQADETLGYLKAVGTVRTLSDAIELQSSHVRRQFETATANAKALAGIASRTATNAAAPVRKALDESLKRPS